MSKQLELPLRELCKAQPGLTSSQAGQRLEAAFVSLARHHSKSPVSFSVIENAVQSAHGSIRWRKPTKRMRRGHANIHDRTEAGAECVSFAAMRALRGLVVKSRLETGTGADWILGDPNSPEDDFEGDIVIEVSGIDFVHQRSQLLERLQQRTVLTTQARQIFNTSLRGIPIEEKWEPVEGVLVSMELQKEYTKVGISVAAHKGKEYLYTDDDDYRALLPDLFGKAVKASGQREGGRIILKGLEAADE